MARILVVDDEFGIAEVLEAVLDDAGHEVAIAINGRQALQKIHEIAPDIVLLDFMMPVMDGPSMLRTLRATTASAQLPVVMISSLPEGTIDASLHGLYAAFIRKPFKLREVLETVDRVLGGSQAMGKL